MDVTTNTHYGVTFRLAHDEPVYHLLRVGGKDFRTVCGRQVGIYRALIPLKHLRKFARLCKGCGE